MRLITSSLLALLIAGAFACDSGKEGCPKGMTECNDGECHECCVDDDCPEKPSMEGCSEDFTICNDDYECECVCLKDGEDCSRDPGACCNDLYCDVYTNTCIPSCTSDEDCPAGDICRNGVCQRPCDYCRSDSDCVGYEICWNGCCERISVPPCSELQECVIAPPSAVTKTWCSTSFSATPFLKSGALAPGFIFTWSSSETGVATVTDGLVTGGADSGISTITAVVDGCETITCDAVLTNYGTLPAGFTRVVVVDEFTGHPIQGTTVVLGAEPPVTTDVIGGATFNVELSDTNPVDITASKQDYHYITLKGVQVDDVIVHMSPLYQLDFSQNPPAEQAGGIFGKFDFGMIRCEPPLKTCAVSLGIAGLSVPPNLTHLNLDMLSGTIVSREIELGGNTEEVLLPTSLVLCLNQTCFDEGIYRATGVPGNRVAWGIGGKLDMEMLMDALGTPPSGGENFILDLSKYFWNLYTAMIPNTEVIPQPVLPDGSPAFDSFPEQDMTLKVKMNQLMTFNAPTLPVGVYNGVVVVGGIIVRGAGFVPLGLASGRDSKSESDTPDGLIEDPIELDVADVAGRIPEGQVQRVVLAFAIKLGQESPRAWAGQIMFVDSFSGTHTLPAFMLPVEATYDALGRRLEVVQVPNGADFLQAVFGGESESSWYVLTEDFASFDLPAAPMEGDRADTAGVYAVDLIMGGYQELVGFNDGNMRDLIELMGAFSYTEMP